ncbi:glycosyltransferase family 2 protein [Empedobacter falsenii]
MNKPLISIIIANYNNGHFFKDCYNSLIAQTEINWEAIIIDDASTDNSLEVIKELISNDFRFKLYQNEQNLGYQKTLIKAIELTTTPIFGRVDPDDALTPYALEKSILAHNQNKNIGLVYSNCIFCDENLNELSIQKGKQVNELIFLNGEISHFATFKKDEYLKTDGIDTFIKRAEDQDIYMKMCEVAPVLHLDDDLYLYRLHSNGSSTNTNVKKAKFWHWVAFIKAAERRGVNVEELFVDNFVSKKDYDNTLTKLELLKKSRLLKFLFKIGLFKVYKYL